MASTQTKTFHAKECVIESVTVYAGSAQVTRRLPATKADATGTLLLVVSGLSQHLDHKSVRIRGAGGYRIQEVSVLDSVVLRSKNEGRDDMEELLTELRNLKDEEAAVKDELSMVSDKNQLIETFVGSQLAGTPKDGIQEFQPFLHVVPQLLDLHDSACKSFGEEKVKLDERAHNLKVAKQVVLDKLRALDGQVYSSDMSAADVFQRVEEQWRMQTIATVEATLEVTSTDTPLEFFLIYNVHCVYWRPTYDVRVDQASGTASLQLYGKINQRTGEDWKDVALTLSTVDPQASTQPPTLPTTRLGIKATTPQPSVRGSRSGLFGSTTASSAVGGYSFAKATPIRSAEDISAAFKVNKPTTVVSSSKSDKRVMITAMENLDVQLLRYAVPTLSTSVFLVGRVKNTSDFPLLAGSMRAFLDGAFVGEASLRAVAPGETFEVPIGTDPSIRVTTFPPKEHEKELGLVSKSRHRTHEFGVAFENNSETEVLIAVANQLPSSTDGKISVKLLQPVSCSKEVYEPKDMVVVAEMTKQPATETAILNKGTNHVLQTICVGSKARKASTFSYAIEWTGQEDIDITDII